MSLDWIEGFFLKGVVIIILIELITGHCLDMMDKLMTLTLLVKEVGWLEVVIEFDKVWSG